MSDQKEFKRRLKVLMNRPENLICVDCNEKQPRWASLIKAPPGLDDGMGMGAFMCLECSGSHRRLGVHIAFVRSVNLDSWKEHEVRIMENGGNRKVNTIFEAHLRRSGTQKPDNTWNGPQRERYIRDKYERRKFYDPAALQDYDDEDDDDDEDDIPRATQPSARRVVLTPVSRAPSDAARRRAEARQTRLTQGGAAIANDRPAKITAPAPAPAPAVDLLDFASFPEEPAPVAVPTPAAAPPPAPSPSKTNDTMDLFANMTVSGSVPLPSAPVTQASPAAPARKTNEDIMSLFSSAPTPATTNNNMMSGTMISMMGAPQQQGMMHHQQVNPMMGQQQQVINPMMAQQMNPMIGQQQQHSMNPMMMKMMQPQQQQQQMMLQQNIMMQNNMMPQQQPNMMNMSHQNAMMGNSMPHQQHMMGMPNNMMANNFGQTMMPGVPGQHMSNGGGMQMTDGGFGGAAMGSGPPISAIQQPEKEDPFAQFGFNAFRS